MNQPSKPASPRTITPDATPFPFPSSATNEPPEEVRQEFDNQLNGYIVEYLEALNSEFRRQLAEGAPDDNAAQ